MFGARQLFLKNIFIEGKVIFFFLKCSEFAACLERLNSATASQEPELENHSPTELFHIRSRAHLAFKNSCLKNVNRKFFYAW
jgi:hypothetical protein